jgi:ZIP family zinc transporter
MVAMVVGFLLFHSIEKFIFVHHVHQGCNHVHPQKGMLSALALVVHSFMDGVGIGLGFQVSPTIGLTVGIAVIAHDFCDGLNTVSLMLASKNTKQRTVTMLLWDSVAPVLGAASASLFILPQAVLMTFLGFFAGFLLYIGSSEVLPQAHSHAPRTHSLRLVTLTALGAALMYVVVRMAG